VFQPKLCVFCGKYPESKTKEHVIPQWLIKMTGDPKRKVSFGSAGLKGMISREFAFDSFHFPACEPCNNGWSNLEAKSKGIVEKLLINAAVKPDEWVTLLDWLDKVRIGLWLGMRVLDKNSFQVEPKFHISDRVGKKDRSLVIAKSTHGERLNFFGLNTIAFKFMPSCFGITINDTSILNISHEFLLSKRLGFPYAMDCIADVNGDYSVSMAQGLEKITAPPLDIYATLCGTAIHQVVYKGWQESERAELWDTDYVVGFSTDRDSGLSLPFLEVESGDVLLVKDADSHDWVPKYRFKNNALAAQYLAGFSLDINEKLWRFWLESVRDPQQRSVALEIEKIVRRDLLECRSAVLRMT
jgi:hypothetical protein